MEAETRLLELAAELAALAPAGLAGAIRALVAAYAPGAPLPRALARGWLASQGDKTALLALSWARERLRLALEEMLGGAAPAGSLPGSPETR